MKKFITASLVTMFAVAGFAQTIKCPDVRLSAPDLIKEGDPATFTANVSGGDANANYTYNWAISAGSITSGQGTPSITVDTKGTGGMTITATVDLGGADRSCNSTASASISVDAAPKTELHTKGDFVNTAAMNEEAAKFAGDFMSAYYGADLPIAVVFIYPSGSPTSAKAVSQMTGSVKMVFAKFGMKPTMYQLKTVGKRTKAAYEMWIVPKGGEIPVATPAK